MLHLSLPSSRLRAVNFSGGSQYTADIEYSKYPNLTLYGFNHNFISRLFSRLKWIFPARGEERRKNSMFGSQALFITGFWLIKGVTVVQRIWGFFLGIVFFLWSCEDFNWATTGQREDITRSSPQASDQHRNKWTLETLVLKKGRALSICEQSDGLLIRVNLVLRGWAKCRLIDKL